MAGGILVTLGIAIAVLSPSIVMSAVGFAIVGLGAANTYPILISAAGATPGVPPSVAVSAVSSVGVLGFLVGPPIIGFVSSAFGLSAAWRSSASPARRWRWSRPSAPGRTHPAPETSLPVR